MSDDRPLVHLKLSSTPETLTLVRSVLGAMGELLTLDRELLDDLKTAVSEACNNVVMHAYLGEPGPLEVELHLAGTKLRAVVRDEGTGIPYSADEDSADGVGLPLMRALTDTLELIDRPRGGTEARMEFPGHRGSAALYQSPGLVAPADDWLGRLDGDAVVSLSPVSCLGPVLGRLARALAARARFSLDRFSDVYLITDAIAAHASRTASAHRVSFSITSGVRRLQIAVAPLRDGSVAMLQGGASIPEPWSALLALSDEIEWTQVEGGGLLSVVLSDKPILGLTATGG